jgi:predicted MFS family arabinose efflux permease
MEEYLGLKELLKRNLEVSEESLKILRKMNRERITARVFLILKWIVIVGFSFATYYYLEPYLKNLLGMAGNLSSGLEKIKQASETLPNLQKLLPR